jgi:stage II sporulation protein D
VKCYCLLRSAAIVAVALSSLAQAQEVRIGVLGLFHPRQLTVSSTAESAVILHIKQKDLVLDSTSTSKVAVHARGNLLVLTYGGESLHADRIVFTSRDGGAADFVLAIPGKITRRYRGRPEIKNQLGELVPVVTMDLETAVASVVAAETLPGEPVEALKAQAVAARSYFVAGKGRHEDFDFCDTTHCQFLRSPPAAQSLIVKAVAATRGLVLQFDSHVFAAMYTRSCSGRTHPPAEVGLPPSVYPYFSVECAYCRRHPARWHSRLAAKDAVGLMASNEPARLQIARKLGWSTIPSNDFTMRKEAGQVVIDGVGRGHGIGLCQAGSKAMAEHGANFREILAHYYPNAVLVDTRPGTSNQ